MPTSGIEIFRSRILFIFFMFFSRNATLVVMGTTLAPMSVLLLLSFLDVVDAAASLSFEVNVSLGMSFSIRAPP